LLANLIEKKRAPIGDFEQALSLFIGSGECAFAMPE
jgi:hypothetical protein